MPYVESPFLSPTAVDEYPADGDVEMDQMACVEEPQNDDS
jgi:hypothetical protein